MTNETAQLVWNLCGLDPEETMWDYDQEGFAAYLRQMLPTRKVNIPYCLSECDGHPYLYVFKNAAAAEARRQFEEENMGYSVEDAVDCITVEMDADDNIVGGTDMIRFDEDDNEVY